MNRGHRVLTFFLAASLGDGTGSQISGVLNEIFLLLIAIEMRVFVEAFSHLPNPEAFLVNSGRASGLFNVGLLSTSQVLLVVPVLFDLNSLISIVCYKMYLPQ